ncbi:hypothetical protein EBQ24_10420 [Allofranklinella schreckenbergeri]|uniref:Uncharacterized protein n=2 Tax=Allofranklinella schreckenbergeri TaxID=1076744 RepID=A0A3M6QVM4_9BURK|nr:hypothetical protein EBQ24_10420 [Allofranklinella schreckenbergeri]
MGRLGLAGGEWVLFTNQEKTRFIVIMPKQGGFHSLDLDFPGASNFHERKIDVLIALPKQGDFVSF